MIDLNELPDTIGEMIETEMRKFEAHGPAAGEGEPDGAPPQAAQDAPGEEPRDEDELSQQLSGLCTQLSRLNTTASLLQGDLFEINGQLDILLEKMAEHKNAGRSLYISDLHFSHKGILRGAGRPFKDAAEMDETLIRLWRERVEPQDRVYILGDLFAWSKHPDAVLEQLTGRLILVVGNHDQHWLPYTRPGRFFEGLCPQLTVRDRGRILALTHVPRKGLLTGDVDYLLYGHLHSNPWHSPLWPWLKSEPRALNVGVDIALAAGAAPAPATVEEWIEYNRVFKERSCAE